MRAVGTYDSGDVQIDFVARTYEADFGAGERSDVQDRVVCDEEIESVTICGAAADVTELPQVVLDAFYRKMSELDWELVEQDE